MVDAAKPRAVGPPTAIPIDLELQKALYRPIILDCALFKACKERRSGSDGNSSAENDSLLTEAQLFKCFVNKLAQCCDSNRGGDTVTSICVLQGDEGPEYVLASNKRDDFELEDVKSSLQKLLESVAHNTAEMKQKTMVTMVLRDVVLMTQPRIKIYLDELSKWLKLCLAHCQRQAVVDLTLQNELNNLLSKSSFPTDNVTGPQAQAIFSSRCVALIRAIVAIYNNKIEEAIINKAKDGEMSGSEAWCELRHYLGRLSSCRQAAEMIVSSEKRWPHFFRNFTITVVPSSIPRGRPLRSYESHKAAEIIRAMCHDHEEDAAPYLSKAADLQKFGLDSLIRKEINRPWYLGVHAEVLVHDYLLKRGVYHKSQYWNGWKYIGSSKPTCRLCSYYFQHHPDRVIVRTSHLNLYHNWRLPDIYDDDPDTHAEQRRLELLAHITERVQEDAKRTLEERVARGKKYDSNTCSAWPGERRDMSEDSEYMSDVMSQSDQGDTSPDTSETPSTASDDEEPFVSAGEESDGDDGGGSL